MKLYTLLIYIASAVTIPATAQQTVKPDWQKIDDELSEHNISKKYYDNAPRISWVGESSFVSYSYIEDGKEKIYIINPKNGKREPLIKDIPSFVHQYVALTQDSAMTEKELKLFGMTFRNNDTSRFYWQRGDKKLVFNRKTNKLALDTSDGKGKKRSRRNFGYSRYDYTTDSLYTMLGDKYNLHVRNNKTGAITKLTSDGKDYASYCYRSAKDTIKEGNAAGFWLGHVYFDFISDDSEVGELYIINSLAQPRPELITRKMPLPNEKDIRRFRLYWYNADIEKGKLLDIDRFTDQNVTLGFQRTEKELWFTRRSRSVDTIQLCRVDVPTGEVKVIISEVCKPHLSVNLFNYSFVDNGRKIIWWSERTGKGNYYLYDTEGNLLNRITQGDDLVAGTINYVDSVSNSIIFEGYGQEKGINPYYRFYYRARLDGKGQQLLTPGDGYHEINMSQDTKYAIDKYSRMDMPPIYNVLDLYAPKRHYEITRVTEEKMRSLKWHAPKLVKVKAADGLTDLYGLMHTPSDLDPQKKYPIITQVYPGPQDDQIPWAFTTDEDGNQSLAELGFIVVSVAPRGSSPFRGRDFLGYSYGNLRDYPLADNRKAILDLAAEYAYIDTTRVGIYGHSGGGFETVASMLTYPDFYKVGVAASGNHDNNIYIQWWGETWHGLSHIPTNMELAGNLKGKLLLISGDMDENVPFASTLRMADALIKKNKRFDMMVLPGKDHGLDGPYYRNLIRYYFLENLVNPTERDIDIINHK